MARRRRHPRAEGQIATYLTLITALILMMTMVTVNVGKVAMTRLQTSNGADAGALAGASWYASVDNEAAELSQLMSDMYHIFQAFMALSLVTPFRDWFDGAAIATAMTGVQFLLKEQAEELVKQGNAFAQFQATAVAFSNAGVDDPRDKSDADSFDAFLEKMADDVRDRDAPDAPPEKSRFSWDRIPSDPSRGANTVIVDRNMRDLRVDPQSARLWWAFKIDCILQCCWPWSVMNTQFDRSNGSGALESTLWPRWMMFIPLPIPQWEAGVYLCAWAPVPWPIYGSINLDNHTDDLSVTVTHCEQQANLRLWRLRYQDPAQPLNPLCPPTAPDSIASTGKAHYGGGRVRGAPSTHPRAKFTAKLVEAK
ncbi:MAG: hypothetical protein HY597_03670 [Candidatus Omnitrophica bacterium]|nr:hypothetical protein [Candidatus Omnitrophota bacterium]